MHAQRLCPVDVRYIDHLDAAPQLRPGKVTLLQSFPGLGAGSGWDVSTAMTTNRLPLPSAETAAMLPCNPVGSWGPAATCAQFAGSKLSPSGSLRAEKNPGSMALGVTSVTVYSGPKPDFTSATLAMSPVEAVVELAPDEQPTSQHTDPTASTALRIVVNLPNAAPELRNVDTVLTSRSAANCGASGGRTDPGSVISRRPRSLAGLPG